MTLRQATERRLQDIRHVFAESEITEHTGRLRYHEGTRQVAGRVGGVKNAFPELRHLKQGPKVIAAAIARRKGKVYRQVREAVERGMIRSGYEERKRGRVSVEPHAGRKYCVHCRELHTKGEHRFHGEGSYHQTHLFAFNPPNVPDPVVIYSDIGTVSNAHKGQEHVCDAECRKYHHRYVHHFKRGKPMMIGLSPGQTITIPEGVYPILLWPQVDRAKLRVR